MSIDIYYSSTGFFGLTTTSLLSQKELISNNFIVIKFILLFNKNTFGIINLKPYRFSVGNLMHYLFNFQDNQAAIEMNDRTKKSSVNNLGNNQMCLI